MGQAVATEPAFASATNWSILLAALNKQRRRLVAGVVVGLMYSLGKIVVPLIVRSAIDRSIQQQRDPLWRWVALLGAVAVTLGIFAGLRRWIAFREARLIETSLREDLFAHLQRLHVGFHDRAQTGQLMSRASTDLQQIQGFVVMIPLTVSNVVMVLGVAGILLWLDPLLAVLAIIPLPFLNLLANRFSRTIHPAVMATQQELAQLATVVEESVAGVRVVKGFGAEHVQAGKLAVEAEDVRRASLNSARVRSTFLPFMDILPTIGLIAVLGVGGHRVLSGKMSLGELVAFNSYLALLIWPLRNIGMTVAFGQRAAAAITRIDDVLSTTPEIADPPNPHALPERVAGRTGRVVFDAVRFGYGEAGDVLDGFALDIAAGQSVALVGATGSGKSTIARLLLRLYDADDGVIELDGVPLRDLRLAELRRAVAMVFEETFLFNDSVSANIAFAEPDADFARIQRAAELAGATEFIAELPHGFDTMLGERGYSLSGGQRQRIAIARAILADPRVLILDDATSAVDPSKEHEIRSALETVMDGRTTIVIAHRPATIALAERVVLIDGGKVIADDTHEGLLATNGRYREVLAAWARRDEEHAESADAPVEVAG